MTEREAVFASIADQAETGAAQMCRESAVAKRLPGLWEQAVAEHRSDVLRVAAVIHPRELAIAALLAAAQWLARQPDDD